MEETLAVIGSRTFPLTQKQYDALGNGGKVATLAQSKALQQGRSLVEARVKTELTNGARTYTMVVSGGARGPDSWGIETAKKAGFKKHQLMVFEAQWNLLGKRAGFVRNTTIAEWGHVLLAFWDGESRGTLDTITKAHEMGKEVVVIFPDGREKNSTRSKKGAHR